MPSHFDIPIDFEEKQSIQFFLQLLNDKISYRKIKARIDSLPTEIRDLILIVRDNKLLYDGAILKDRCIDLLRKGKNIYEINKKLKKEANALDKYVKDKYPKGYKKLIDFVSDLPGTVSPETPEAVAAAVLAAAVLNVLVYANVVLYVNAAAATQAAAVLVVAATVIS